MYGTLAGYLKASRRWMDDRMYKRILRIALLLAHDTLNTYELGDGKSLATANVLPLTYTGLYYTSENSIIAVTTA